MNLVPGALRSRGPWFIPKIELEIVEGILHTHNLSREGNKEG